MPGIERRDPRRCEERRSARIRNLIGEEIERRLLRETRVVVLGHLQRGGPPTTFDRVLATQFGAHAVRLVVEAHFGQMVCYHPPLVHQVPIIDAVHELSTVDCNGAAVQAARAMGISFGDSPADQGSPCLADNRTRSGPLKPEQGLPVIETSLTPTVECLV